MPTDPRVALDVHRHRRAAWVDAYCNNCGTRLGFTDADNHQLAEQLAEQLARRYAQAHPCCVVWTTPTTSKPAEPA